MYYYMQVLRMTSELSNVSGLSGELILEGKATKGENSEGKVSVCMFCA